eukprot:GHUV01039705.1.p2 GENE.GHUV01039705.1~~GHUV01039705.1.p2  ORF type:complete len:110 (-),score=23.61 GHUV01039705.1:385-714(-)
MPLLLCTRGWRSVKQAPLAAAGVQHTWTVLLPVISFMHSRTAQLHAIAMALQQFEQPGWDSSSSEPTHDTPCVIAAICHPFSSVVAQRIAWPLRSQLLQHSRVSPHAGE